MELWFAKLSKKGFVKISKGGFVKFSKPGLANLQEPSSLKFHFENNIEIHFSEHLRGFQNFSKMIHFQKSPLLAPLPFLELRVFWEMDNVLKYIDPLLQRKGPFLRISQLALFHALRRFRRHALWSSWALKIVKLLATT